jgi:hypothetical protein
LREDGLLGVGRLATPGRSRFGRLVIEEFRPADSTARGEGQQDMMPEWLRNVRQAFSWKLGYRRGKAGRNYLCPWWADRLVFAVAYMQGRTAAGKPRRPRRQSRS